MIGDKLRELRIKNNLTQKDISEIFNIDYTTWSSYERNRTEPSIELLAKIVKYFNISLNELLGTNDPNKKEIIFTKKEVDKLIDVINMLNDKLK